MKYNEFFRLAKKNGWILLLLLLVRYGKGSNEIWVNKQVKISILNHGSKEMPKGLERKLRKQMNL